MSSMSRRSCSLPVTGCGSPITADGRWQARLNNGAYIMSGNSTRTVTSSSITAGRSARTGASSITATSTTSHASQGRNVQCVFVGQSSESFVASSREQFYVSASQGRERVTIYTDDKEALLDAVKRSDERLTATEFINGIPQRQIEQWHEQQRKVTDKAART